MLVEGLDDRLELVRYVDLVRVEEEQNQITALGEPLHDLGEVVVPAHGLLGAGQDAGRVDEREFLREVAPQLGDAEFVEERGAVAAERSEWPSLVGRRGVARDGRRARAVHQRGEAVRRRLGADVDARKVAPREVADERRLARRVLTQQQDHGFRQEFRVRQERRRKPVEEHLLLRPAHLLAVQAHQRLGDRAVVRRRIRALLGSHG